ncbi:unnamed protein product [Porites lobata]|uniref:TLDc domain-containing protein n=1 Tax=Porites lobata TaxID=104759 RepID=A0ABN8NJY7_9CNID|nr:unnamed protein product [Porites lobata]
MSGKCDLEDLFKSFAQQMPLRGCELLQTAFKIPRFSRKQLEQRKKSSITSLKEVGILPWELLCSWLPVRVRIKRPFCLFTTNDAGYSGCDHAIWLDDELKRGQSGPTETFGNVQLTEDKDFVCNRVEVLGFVTEN